MRKKYRVNYFKVMEGNKKEKIFVNSGRRRRRRRRRRKNCGKSIEE